MNKNQTYKESMIRLEEILNGIDESEIGIDELSESVEEAAKLLKTCKNILNKTQKKVSTALEDLENEFKEEEF